MTDQSAQEPTMEEILSFEDRFYLLAGSALVLVGVVVISLKPATAAKS